MKSASPKISIKHDVFMWLYTTSGCNENDITASIPPKLWREWIHNEKDPELTIPQMKDLARIYKRPITAFLISEPPSDTIIPIDFRGDSSKKTYSKDLHQKFIKAHRNLELFVDMANNMGEPVATNLKHYSIEDDPFKVAEIERNKFHAEEIFSEKDPAIAYRLWRVFFTEMGIPIFQYNLSGDGVRGFITKADNASAIIVNSNEKVVSARIFTIFHEYAHLILGSDPVCIGGDEEFISDPKIQKTERWCDNFAGAFLMPVSIIDKNQQIKELIADANYEKAAYVLAKETATSKTAALVRLVVIGYIPREDAEPLLSKLRYTNATLKTIKSPGISDEEEEEENESSSNKKSSGGPDRAKISVSGVGESFVHLAQRNYDAGHITYTSLLENIGVTKNSYERLKKERVIQ